jgi:hypothetical protein
VGSITSAEAPMKLKFQPRPTMISVPQKWPTVMPDSPITAASASSSRPTDTTIGAPKRAIRAPVKKLGAYIAMMCH